MRRLELGGTAFREKTSPRVRLVRKIWIWLVCPMTILRPSVPVVPPVGLIVWDWARATWDDETSAQSNHAEACRLLVGGGIPGKNFPGQLKQNALHIYVKDVDEVTDKAIASGAILIDEPRDQEYGERSSSVKDKAGNMWYIAEFSVAFPVNNGDPAFSIAAGAAQFSEA